jgi:hypothetical protein
MWMKKLSVLALLLLSLNSMALPILTESVNGQGLLATIYPDHEDANKVYFLPNRGSLQVDSRGVPEFGMSYWGISKESPDAGGYFVGIFNLSMGGDLKKAVETHLAQGKQVAVIPVQSSHVHFKEKNGVRIMQDLFKEVDLPAFAGRVDDSFSLSASLTKNGARMLAAQIRSGAVGTDLNYCYSITGLSPVFDAKITLNYHKIYTHFLAQASFGRWWYRVNIRTEIEKLIENSSIKIVINGGDAKKYDYIMALVDRMSEKFFVPELENRRNAATGRIGISYTQIVEDREQTFQLTQREIIQRDFCLGMGLGQLKDFPFLIVDTDAN